MDLPQGIEARIDRAGVTRYRAHARQGRRKLRGPWTPVLDEAIGHRAELLGPVRAEREKALAGMVFAGGAGDSGVVYFVQAGAKGPVKVGHTRGDVLNRLDELQTAHYEELHLLGTRPGTKADEHILHKRYASARIRREWFRPVPELLAEIS